MKKGTWFIFALLLVMSCLDNPDCFQLNENVIGISFRVMGSSKSDTLFFTGIRMNDTDAVFANGVKLTGVALPLDFVTNHSEIFFSSNRGEDTLHLGYKVGAQFVSEDCGSRFILSDLEILKYSFDSIRVVNGAPGKTAGGNIEIFRCARTDTMTIAFRQLTVVGTTRGSQAVNFDLNSLTADFVASPLYENQAKSIVYLPVNMVDSSVVFTFDVVNVGVKKVDLSYKLTTRTLAKKCGEQIFVSGMTINKGDDAFTFDSVSFAKDDNDRPIRSVRDPFDPMIQIYLCPQFDIAELAFKNTTGKNSNVLLQKVSVSTDTVNHAPSDSVQLLKVPLNKNAGTTKIDFEFASGDKRTLTLKYERASKSYFRTACPEQTTVFTKLDTVATNFSKIKIVQPNLPSIPVKNVEITY
jgi:hypothetical protein